jgi:hypothetical protein
LRYDKIAKNACKHPQLRKKFSTCYHWKKAFLDPSSLLKVVRIAYPNSTRGDVFKEFAMKSPSDSIYYLKPTEKENGE